MQKHENAQQGQATSAHSVDPKGQAMRDAMWKGHGGFELALTPAFFGLVGWVLDGVVGTTPLFTVLFAVVGLVGSVANQYFRYTASMERATAQRLAATDRPSIADSASEPAKRFGPVEYREVDMTIRFDDEPRLDQAAAS